MKTRIMVVEDEHDTLEMMTEVFLSKGYDVDKASNFTLSYPTRIHDNA